MNFRSKNPVKMIQRQQQRVRINKQGGPHSNGNMNTVADLNSYMSSTISKSGVNVQNETTTSKYSKFITSPVK
jgi:hypothetical protein